MAMRTVGGAAKRPARTVGPMARRLGGNPIIRPAMLPAGDGGNINGPSLIRAPGWLERPLGRYYLYFAHHQGEYIRLACADRLGGPWRVHVPGTLRLADAPFIRKHVASPDVIVDDERRELRMYFHGPTESGQMSFAAISRDGLAFAPRPEPLGIFYFRVFRSGGWWYAMAKGGRLYRSRDGLTGFEEGPIPFPGGGDRDKWGNSAGPRHVAVLPDGKRLWIYYTSIGDAPERIFRCAIDARGDWRRWRTGQPVEVLRPERRWEGAALEIRPSAPGACRRENALRDPAVFVEEGRTYLLYSIAGEDGLAIAELGNDHREKPAMKTKSPTSARTRKRPMRDPAKRRLIEDGVAAEAARARGLALAIHDLAEPGFREERSARLLAAYLRERGFEVEFRYRNIPTAFRAWRGSGRPAVGILGEYDALPDCGPRPGQWGHGCGHDLLGVGSAVGAAAAAEALARRGERGTVVYYGCPAEELLAGKAYMARDGAFRDLDACLAWHPSGKTNVCPLGGSAMDSLLFDFAGRTAHGASAHNGRSALDAAMLTDVAANYLREHVPENVRIHMVVRRGGDAPNVVPARAQAWYYVRGKDRKQVDEVRERLVNCARGAALATGTKLRVARVTGIYSRLANAAMDGVLRANLELFGAPRAGAADRREASRLGAEPDFKAGPDPDQQVQERGSTDEDSVSWLAPLGRFNMACHTRGIKGHHRETAAHNRLPFAHRGMLQAAKVLAGSALDLIADRATLARARAEFRKGTKGFRYDPLVPRGRKVPVDLA